MLETNQQLGRYILRSRLGSGGMGEVYVAHDPKIGRDVAIKVLSAEHSKDSDRLARFEQEAQAAGSLNHPNIVAVFDVDMNDGTPYVVSELLEGETLRSALGHVGLPIRKSLDYAMQIAHGLAAAHERGIIHRDLKPENIFVTSDGRVKILDFGLAKLIQRDSPSEETFSDESTKQVSTDPGTVMGTMGYMSPEQLRGQPIDSRTDIFSFGAVFYEMLTGKRAFHRDSTADTISAVLREELSEPSETNKSVRPSLDKLVQRCLAKNREQRFHSASDLAFALDAVSGSETSGELRNFRASLYDSGPSPISPRLRAWAGWIAAALMLTAAVTYAALYYGRQDKPAPVMRFAVPAPAQTTFGLSSVISPDGRSIAFTAIRDSYGKSTLWIRSLATMEATEIPGTEEAAFPFWSPDSREVAFFAPGKLKKVVVGGGTPQILADVSKPAADMRGGSWSSNGIIVYTPDIASPLFKVSAQGGTPSEVTTLNAERAEKSHRWPSFLPDGNTFLYFGRGDRKALEGIYAARIDGGEPKLILHNAVMGLYAASPSGKGHLLFARYGALMAQAFDPDKLELSGDPWTVEEDVMNFATEVGATAYGAFSVSQNGTLLFRSGGDQTTRFAWFDRAGKEISSGSEPGIYREPRLSPDGKRIAYVRSTEVGEDIHVLDIASGTDIKLTFDSANDVTPVWSPDGNRIVFGSSRDGGTLKLYERFADGSGGEKFLYGLVGNLRPDDFTPDGSTILFDFDSGATAKNDLMLLPAAGGEARPYLQTPFVEAHATFSPDGRWVAYTSDENGKLEVFVQSYPVGRGKWLVSTRQDARTQSTLGGDHPQWSRDGRWLFYLQPDRNLIAVPVNLSGTFSKGNPERLFETKIPLMSLSGDRNNFLVSPDGQRFFINNLVEANNTKPLTLVLNWEAGMQR